VALAQGREGHVAALLPSEPMALPIKMSSSGLVSTLLLGAGSSRLLRAAGHSCRPRAGHSCSHRCSRHGAAGLVRGEQLARAVVVLVLVEHDRSRVTDLRHRQRRASCWALKAISVSQSARQRATGEELFAWQPLSLSSSLPCASASGYAVQSAEQDSDFNSIFALGYIPIFET